MRTERSLLAGNVPRGHSPMELPTPHELSQTTKVQIPTVPGRVTIPDPSDTLGDQVVERTNQQLVEAADRLVPCSGESAPDDSRDK